ncbi:hypothetical protein MAV_0833 [Mycobacterium avium 104]|uniref:Uncharacterized protein n=1 Tax=Mycobacterium avium (strain 104) TaxID=243243 RepID=A0A0H3A3K7_MYCA1|nr:hypothetical protein MAV_0833 [Mycobacterium avium 104]
MVWPASRIGCSFAGLLFFQPVVRCAEPSAETPSQLALKTALMPPSWDSHAVR